MGAYSRRQLRAALNFLLRPLLLALGLTILVRFIFAPGRPKHSKALVVASTQKSSDDASKWLRKVPYDWAIHKYITGLDSKNAKRQKALAVPTNKGNEAMVYLTFIIDNYDSLPDVVLFHHDHTKAWHQELSSIDEVSKLKTAYVVKKGYVSTRCLPGCENVVTVADYAIDMSVFSYHGREAHLATMLRKFLGEGETVPSKLAAPCCAQFAASREAIRRRSLIWWTDLREWLIQTPLDSRTSGRLLEYTWHIWLGEQAELCPRYEECRCNVFGIGDCKGLDSER